MEKAGDPKEYATPLDRLLPMTCLSLPLCLAFSFAFSLASAASGAPARPAGHRPHAAAETASGPPRPVAPDGTPAARVFTPRHPEPVVAGQVTQLQPSACTLPSGTTLLSFELLRTANQRRVYVKRRRPGFGWSFGREVPLPKGAYSMRHGSLVCRENQEVLLYAQAGDLRRRRARIHRFSSQGDSLHFSAGQSLTLGLPADAALTEPFAATPKGGRGVLLTVTRRFSGTENLDGCYLARSPDGRRFPGPAQFLGPGEGCRTVSLGPGRLLVTYQKRASLRDPWQAFCRLSTNDGASFDPETPVARLRESFDAHPSPAPGGGASIYHLAALGKGTALFVTRLNQSGRPTSVRRLTLLGRARILGPFALPGPKGDLVFFAREIRPLDFDILSGTVEH